MTLATRAAPPAPDEAPDRSTGRRRPWWRRPEPLLALAGFVAMAAVVLSHATALLEPDDYAYRASIVALAKGQVLLSSAEYRALVHQLSLFSPAGIAQWHHLASGRWISEKNPGYPFLAVPFYLARALRLAPLFYGALGALGLYHGARAWLGRWAGAYAVWLFCFSGAALTFAWRATMPSFTDASLVAAGAGSLLWALVRTDASDRRRRLVGLGGFLALEGAVFVRYTNVVELAVAALAAIVFARAARVGRRTLALWLGSVAVFGAGVLGFDQWAYGHATSTGYSAGEISFAWSALWPNLKVLPRDLAEALPLWLLGALGLGWIAWRAWHHRRAGDARGATTRRDAAIAGALGAGWLAQWLWYLTYTWTAQMSRGGGGSDVVHLVRFYLPAMGPLALLGAWVLVRAARPVAWCVVGAVVVAALMSFHVMAASAGLSGAGGPGPGGVAHAPNGAPHGLGGRPPSRAGTAPPPGVGGAAPG